MLLSTDRDFRRIFAADATSKFGTQVSALALPFLAQSALHADPAHVGLLAMLTTLSFLLVGLPAGAWIDRLRKRPVMIGADLIRAVLLASVPLAWACGALTLAHLYAVVGLMGVATVLFDVAHLSYVPHVVGRDRLLAANTALVSLNSVADVSGRGLGGLIVQAAGAPQALLLDVTSYLASALLTARVGGPEPILRKPERASLLRDVGEGLRFVFRHPRLRPIALEGALTNLGIQLAVVSLLITLADSPGTAGLFLAAGGLGTLAGSLAAPRLRRSLGTVRSLWLPGPFLAPFALAIGLDDLRIAGAAWAITLAKTGLDNVLRVSFRQRATPPELLGRMNATFRFLLASALAVGAALAGLIAQTAGPRAALWAAAGILSVRWVLTLPLKGAAADAAPTPRATPDADPRPDPTSPR
ncbi:MFS transporter [Streptomyces sp. NPDC093801]|uniref:MFS transporter n=1 Tax=Streptomyces sp. NPDC093801 TaxID=3155203 RepID=UPI00344CAB30